MIDIVNVIYVLQIEQLYKKEVKILCHMLIKYIVYGIIFFICIHLNI